MSGERHAYGTSLGCLSRRLLLLASFSVLMVLCYLQLFKWAIQSHLLDVHAQVEEQREPQDCTGTDCLEVFTCYGMRETTFHLREPFITAGGALALPLGVFGAHQGVRWQVQVAAIYLAIDAALRFSIIAADSVYFSVCDAYSYNVVDQILLQTRGLIRLGTQEKIALMSSYSVERIDAVTGGFHTLAFYLAFAGAWLIVVAYLARESQLLEQLLERGPLGLGMHYGLDQWDDAFYRQEVARIRRMKESVVESDFINDATIPERKSRDQFPGFLVGSWGRQPRGYGATSAAGSDEAGPM